MSDLAMIHLRQARSFVRAGNPAKAVELLEKAKVLVRENIKLEAQILEQLAECYDAIGNAPKASLAREKLGRLFSHDSPNQVSERPQNVSHSSPSWKAYGPVLLIVLGCVAGLGMAAGYLILRQPTEPQVVVPTPKEVAASAPSTTRPAVANGENGIAPASQKPANPGAAPSLAPAAANQFAFDRQELFKETVGMIVVVLRYEGPVNGIKSQINIPLGTGTCFAVGQAGILLTNKHVVDAAKASTIPISLEQFHLPTMTLRSTSYIVCFGTEPGDRYVAELLHKSDKFDMAILKINRHIDRPLTFATRELRQGDDILVCGYPGAVMAAMNMVSSTPAHSIELSQKWKTSHQIDAFDEFSPESFNSTLTKGIVSAPERNVQNVSYMQIDAAISPGNSGGPVFNKDNEVVSMATFGLRPPEGGMSANYNFGLLMDQMLSEIRPYLRD